MDALYLPAGKTANMLRGALGLTFRSLVCAPACPGAKVCDLRASCPYAQVFEPTSEHGPRGLADLPRPFVFRARHLEGRRLIPGEPFGFDVNIFSPDPEVHAYFVRALEALGLEGFGPGRGRAHLLNVSARNISFDLDRPSCTVDRIRVEFLSPTELKHDQRIVERPEFPVLYARVRDRVAMLASLYAGVRPDLDFRGTSMRSAVIEMTACDTRQILTTRRSTKTGQCHPIGGFVGSAEYYGNLTEFMPCLEAGCWTGVGRQAVWGKGEIAVHKI